MNLVSLLTLPFALAHMEMAEPAPRRSKHLKGVTNVDYDMTSPLGGRFSYPCRGFPSGPISKKYSAGQAINVAIEGGAPHNGGHCQFALSFNGQDFVNIHTVFGTCPQPERSFSVQIPKNFPSGKAVFAWVWNNRVGNRELYMNCADIEITGGSGMSYTGPELLIANFDVPGKKVHRFPEGFANDFGKDLFAAQPKITISSSGSSTYQPTTGQGNDSNTGDQQDIKGNKTTSEYPTTPKENPTNNKIPSESNTEDNKKKGSDNNMSNYPADTSGTQQPNPIRSESTSDSMDGVNGNQGSHNMTDGPEYPPNAEPKDDKPTAIPNPCYDKQPENPRKETSDSMKAVSGAGCNDGGIYCEGQGKIGICFLGAVTFGPCAPGTKCQEPKPGQAQCV
ncbi:hypothetical protein DSO57_1002314 [Entomophthora muscae]|uniref:Uncharacterized protein n=2 Tax=Entomophthora muscae TaxID=34485 RepID=A0ACC2UHM5_9FUNG|nr:hypothetical protein DSO57_1002311 [Entomophthora muscae]KAJ9086592.1 hypothetical protein DSO57_1002314 [Entomophthora muscae]